METRTAWAYISFARLFVPLKAVRSARRKPIAEIENLLTTWEELDRDAPLLPVYADLQSLNQKWQRRPHSLLGKKEANVLRQLIRNLEKTLQWEMARITICLISKDEPVELTSLLSRYDKTFFDEVYPCLPQIAQEDIEEAAHCLILTCPVGGAMLAFRCFERVFRGYYDLLQVPNLRKRDDTMGTLARELREWTEKAPKNHPDKPSRKLVSYVSTIVHLRNDTMHPADRKDIPTARNYFAQCIDAIREIAKDLARRGLLDQLAKTRD
jgi:hypothetical protein